MVLSPQSTVHGGEILGLVLAGGRSSRMGRDKSLIEYHGKPQVDYLAELLASFCNQVFISCKQTEQMPAGLNYLFDQFPMDSPLNGVLSAFNFNSNAAWLTVPVDMPLIDSKTIAFLILNRDASKAATCFLDSDGKNPEPLFTLWEPKAFKLLSDFYNSGKVSPRYFLKQADVKLLTVPNLNVLTNINSVDELKKFIDHRTVDRDNS